MIHISKDNNDRKIQQIKRIYKSGFQNLTQPKKNKMRFIIINQIKRIQTTLDNHLRRDTVQKKIQQNNLKERNLLQNRIKSKLDHAERLRTENYEKVQNTQREHINYVTKISQKMKDNNNIKQNKKINLEQIDHNKSTASAFQRNVKNGYKSLSNFRNNYQQALLKKQQIFQKNVKFADNSHFKMLDRLHKSLQNRYNLLKSKENTFLQHQQLVRSNYIKHQYIQRQKTQKYLNMIIESRHKLDERVHSQKLKKNSKNFIKNQSKNLSKRLSLVNKNQKQQNPEQSKHKFSSLNGEKVNYSSQLFKQLPNTSRKNIFLPKVKYNKILMQQRQSMKQAKIINKHNQQYQFLKNKQNVSDKALSLYKSTLFNKDTLFSNPYL